ncbi:hypothetical protein Mal64_11840 [Pseudobythopirellula maris]|uniref:Transposase IS200-like domain-containing protein n=1 Tax=Pseudobythopirellula maris TaxID=2527991 RepID=A0A5C5ZUX8_9BACT|nr:hypothetical protein [Pseudobythopirellula maris]TWT90787.1 hypothetical protein Mal64_11840 [Pseudobythopirellula maris]
MPNTLGILVTMTTYGSWLRGDRRGWIDDGQLMPPCPALETADRVRMKHTQYKFQKDALIEVGRMIGESLVARQGQQILAMSVDTWHAHFMISATRLPIGDVVKCAKDAARYGLRPGRPIWTDGYDKRFCFDERTLANRIRYVERHNERHGWPAKPWPFIVDFDPIKPPVSI